MSTDFSISVTHFTLPAMVPPTRVEHKTGKQIETDRIYDNTMHKGREKKKRACSYHAPKQSPTYKSMSGNSQSSASASRRAGSVSRLLNPPRTAAEAGRTSPSQ